MNISPETLKAYRPTRETKAHMRQLGQAALAEPTPLWFGEYNEMAAEWLGKVRKTPLYEAVTSGGDLDHAGLVKVHRDIGHAAVFPFPDFLDNMAGVLERNGESKTPPHTFITVNRYVELFHGEHWRRQATGLRVPLDQLDQAKYPLSAPAVDLRDHLTGLSERSTAHAVGGVNFAIETGAAYLTQELAPHLLARMPDRTSGKWMAEHAEGDEVHSAISRKILVDRIGDDIGLRREVGEVVLMTFDKSLALYQDVYPGEVAA